jgi:hypothetical protein
MAPYLRLRQICLVARALEPAVADLADVLAIEECHRDPNVAKYGLVNALLPVGTSFLEIVSPTKADTAAGRFLARRGGDAGYMVICDCDDNSRFRTGAAAAGVRTIEDHVYEGRAHLLQLHPRDTGGCILEFDHHVGGAALDGAYQWAGEHWQRHVRTTRVAGITGVTMTSSDPEALGRRRTSRSQSTMPALPSWRGGRMRSPACILPSTMAMRSLRLRVRAGCPYHPAARP